MDPTLMPRHFLWWPEHQDTPTGDKITAYWDALRLLNTKTEPSAVAKASRSDPWFVKGSAARSVRELGITRPSKGASEDEASEQPVQT